MSSTAATTTAAVAANRPAARDAVRDALRTVAFEARRRLGRLGSAGIALAVVGVVLAAALAPTLELRADDLLARAAANREERAARRVEELAAPSGAQFVDHFVEVFPSATTQIDDLAFLVAQAKANGVTLARADYQIKNETTLGLVRYQISLPVQARYSTLRSFVAAVLNAKTHAALDELTLERKETDTIDARLRFTFIYRSADGN